MFSNRFVAVLVRWMSGVEETAVLIVFFFYVSFYFLTGDVFFCLSRNNNNNRKERKKNGSTMVLVFFFFCERHTNQDIIDSRCCRGVHHENENIAGRKQSVASENRSHGQETQDRRSYATEPQFQTDLSTVDYVSAIVGLVHKRDLVFGV